MKPLAIDLFCGLGGWSEALIAEGWEVVGFDIERHIYDEHRYPAQLVLQDVLTLHGSQFRDAALIVASPPCQKYSYMAMPWTRAKKLAEWYRDSEHPERIVELNALFDACFRIQREASESAGRHIPMIVENVRGAIPWVGRSRWNFGSFHLWDDVPALMPLTFKGSKVIGFRFDGSGGSFQTASVNGLKTDGSGWRENGTLMSCNRFVSDGTKMARQWWTNGANALSAKTSSKSSARKAASAMIAKIPRPLAQHIAAVYNQNHAIST